MAALNGYQVQRGGYEIGVVVGGEYKKPMELPGGGEEAAGICVGLRHGKAYSVMLSARSHTGRSNARRAPRWDAQLPMSRGLCAAGVATLQWEVPVTTCRPKTSVSNSLKPWFKA